MAGLDLLAKVKQYGYGALDDGAIERLRMNREGALHINDRQALVDSWTRDGRVFIFNNPVIGQPETMSANGTAITLTDPSIRYTVPAGAIVVPIHLKMKIGGVITKDDIFAIVATGSDSFTSGGDTVLMTAKNAFVQPNGVSLRGATVEKLHYSDTAIVEAALVNPRLLYIDKHEGVVGEVDLAWHPEYNILKGDPMVYMEGPASFLAFVVQETTAAEAEWSGSFAVLDPKSVGR